MKIAVISLGRLGAGPMYSFEMAKALSQKAIVLCIVSTYAENIKLWRAEEKVNSNLQLYEVPTYTNLFSFVVKTLFIWRYIKIAQVINKFSPDILYSPFGHFWHKFVFEKVQCKIKINTCHDVVLHDGENGVLRSLLDRIFSYKADKCVVLSEIFRKTMAEKHGYDLSDIIVIPHASFQQYQNSYSLDLETKRRIIFFGRIVRYKGLGILLEALKIIRRSYPDIKLLIVGNGDISEYKSQIEELKDNIETHVRWIKDDEVASFFNDVDVAVLPYTDASQSGVIPLANSFGKPAVASNSGGLPAQILNNKTGITLQVNNPTALANTIIDLYNDENRLKELKNNAFEFSKINSWEHSAEILLENIE